MNFKNNDSGAEEMETVQDKYKPLIQSKKVRLPIQTTLYELMETVIEVAGREDGKLVNEATIKILVKAKPRIRISQSLRY
jgi:hypothetical protein